MSSGGVVSMRGGTQVLISDPQNAATSSSANATVGGRPAHKFTFDYAYSSANPSDADFVNQQQVYDDLGTDVVDNAFSGYNACVFAYGQTGSGKTYTMMGTEDDRGLIPRICKTMFEKMTEGKDEGTTYRFVLPGPSQLNRFQSPDITGFFSSELRSAISRSTTSGSRTCCERTLSTTFASASTLCPAPTYRTSLNTWS
jgi:maltoporin